MADCFWTNHVSQIEELCTVAEYVPAPDTGYTFGGYAPTATDDIFGLIFSTDTEQTISAVLSIARGVRAACNSSSRGYVLGGGKLSFSLKYDDIDGIIFSSNSAFTSSAVLSVARCEMTAHNSSTKGYAAGGFEPGVAYKDTVDGVIFSSDTGFVGLNTLPGAPTAASSSNSAIKGYIHSGADSGSYGAKLFTLTFSTEVTALSATTVAVKRYAAGFNSTTYGYAAGSTVYTTLVAALSFSTETASTSSGVLSIARGSSAGFNSSTKGYAAGGSAPLSTIIDGIIFGATPASDTSFISSIVLSSARYQHDGCQSGGYL